jgi:hypothetical protein
MMLPIATPPPVRVCFLRARGREVTARSWVCVPSQTSDFMSFKLGKLIEDVTVSSCDRMNAVVALAHEVDSTYVFETGKVLFALAIVGVLFAANALNSR